MKQNTIPYLIFAGHHAAIVNVPPDLSSDGYGALQQWFAKHTKSRDEYAVMRHLWSHNQINGVWYHEELAGPDGAAFEVFQLPDTPPESLEFAVSKIRRDFDVVSLRVKRFEKLHDIQADVDRIAAEDKLSRV